MRSRVIIGTIATVLFVKEFVSVNKLEFPYPYISQPNNKVYQNSTSNKVQYRKNTWLLSLKNPQLFAQKFQDLTDNDLVLCETPKGERVFKIVGAVSRNYAPFENGVSNYIPPGFVFLVDPIKKEVGMENIAVITSKKHYSLGKFEALWNKLSGSEKVEESSKQSPDVQSLERKILQRNNIREQIAQAQVYTNQSAQSEE